MKGQAPFTGVQQYGLTTVKGWRQARVTLDVQVQNLCDVGTNAQN